MENNLLGPKLTFESSNSKYIVLNLWTIVLQENESNWEVELCSGISKTMYNGQGKFETNMIIIDQLITTLSSIH